MTPKNWLLKWRVPVLAIVFAILGLLFGPSGGIGGLVLGWLIGAIWNKTDEGHCFPNLSGKFRL